MASIIISAVGSEVERISNHSNSYGIIFTLRVRAGIFINANYITIRSQFIPNDQPLILAQVGNFTPYYRRPNELRLGSLNRGEEVTAVGWRRGAFADNEEWSMLSTGVWVRSVDMEVVRVAGAQPLAPGEGIIDLRDLIGMTYIPPNYSAIWTSVRSSVW